MIAHATTPRMRLAPPEDFGLGVCDEALASHLDAVRRHYGPAGLGVIDLPSLETGRLVAEQIRVCGVLYWASEVEQAGLLPFIEALAEGIISGSVVEPLGGAIPQLTRFWRGREHRFTGTERRALFARIFGDGTAQSQSAFAAQFTELIRALVAVNRTPHGQPTSHLEARVAVLAQDVGSALSTYGAGIAGFAARDIIAQIRAALVLMQDGDLVRALGGGGVWQIIARHAPRLLRYPVHPEVHLARATAGMRVIAWLANEAPALDAGALRLGRADAVLHEAEAWSAASGAG